MSQTILVTGATGTVGSQVVKQLIEKSGARILAGSRHPEKADALRAIGAHMVSLDMNDPGSVAQAFAGVDKLFLLTPSDINMTRQADNALSAAEAAGIQHIVRLSSYGAETDPGIMLTRLHRSVERGIMGSQINFTLLRPNGFMQNYAQFVDSIRTDSKFYLPAGEAKVSLIDVQDIASVASDVLLEPSDEYYGKMIDLTGPEAIDNTQIAEVFTNVLGRRVEYIAVSDETAAEEMRSKGVPAHMVEAITELYQWYKTGAGALVSSAVMNITGQPARSFEDYLRANHAQYE